MGGNIVFFVNPEKPDAHLVKNKLVNIAKEKGYSCFELNLSASCKVPEEPLLLIAIGGDGTVLKAVPYAVAHNIPILGVNTGRIGFLSEIRPDGFAQALNLYFDNALLVEERMMLTCRVNGIKTCICLNDMLLYKKTFSGVALISFLVNGDDAGTVYCDGMIISTPTGSTGYSISAGGPIIAPGIDACAITPVCSHSLLARPVVTPGDATLSFRMHSAGCLYADGQKIMDVDEDDEIVIVRALHRAQFLRVSKHNVFSLIREKLI